MIVYGSSIYDAELYTANPVTGSFLGVYSIEFLYGTTVFLTPTISANIPVGSMVKIYGGNTVANLTEIPLTGGPITFDEPDSGTKDLYIKVELITETGQSPEVTSLSVLVSSTATLYTTAITVLEDGLLNTGVDFEIDPWLREVKIPFSWFDTVKHRFALGRIAEASGGSVYQDRHGIIQVEAGNYLKRVSTMPVKTITQDQIYDAKTPVEEIRNRVSITTKPYVKLSDQQVWELVGDNEINAGDQKSFEVFFSDFEAVIDPYASLMSTPAGASIVSENWFDWGGRVTILGSSDGQIITLTARGEPLVVRGRRLMQADDSASIQKSGLRELVIDDNALLQDATIAQTIANEIVAITGESKRSISLSWRGDPALELGDLVVADGIEGWIVAQKTVFNGILKQDTTIRRR